MLEVIGTGFGRTGTDSMRKALNILGFGPCHHMHEIIEHEHLREVWRDHARTGQHSWEELFPGYRSCVDWPSAAYWRELVDDFPDAKVLLTWRTPESWWTSFSNTILPSLQNSEDQQSVGNQVVMHKEFGGRAHNRDHAIAVYEAHVQAVKDHVAPERLLIFKIGDGWTPLCAHLGVPVPDMPFPRRNSTAEFNANEEAQDKD